MFPRQSIKKFIGRSAHLEAFARWMLYRANLGNTEIELELLRRLPRNALNVAIDVGAAVGEYSWLLARKARMVYSFEPYPPHYRILTAFRLPHLIVEPLALGDHPGRAQLRVPILNHRVASRRATLASANALEDADDTQITDVPVTTLDAYLQAKNTPSSVDFIKIDVEGHELAVLQGATETLRLSKPAVLIEIEIRHNPDYAEIFLLLHQWGYRAYCTIDGRRFKPVEPEMLVSMQRPGNLDRRSRNRRRGSQVAHYFNNFLFLPPGESPLKTRVDLNSDPG